MIFNDEKIIRAIKDAPNGSELKIFFYIVFNQPSEGICGYRTTKQQLAIDLKMNIATVFRSLRWLEENLLIQEIKQAIEEVWTDFTIVVKNCYCISVELLNSSQVYVGLGNNGIFPLDRRTMSKLGRFLNFAKNLT